MSHPVESVGEDEPRRGRRHRDEPAPAVGVQESAGAVAAYPLAPGDTETPVRRTVPSYWNRYGVTLPVTLIVFLAVAGMVGVSRLPHLDRSAVIGGLVSAVWWGALANLVVALLFRSPLPLSDVDRKNLRLGGLLLLGAVVVGFASAGVWALQHHEPNQVAARQALDASYPASAGCESSADLVTTCKTDVPGRALVVYLLPDGDERLALAGKQQLLDATHQASANIESIKDTPDWMGTGYTLTQAVLAK